MPIVFAIDCVRDHATAPFRVAKAVTNASRASWTMRHAIGTRNSATRGRDGNNCNAHIIWVVLQHRAEQGCHFVCEVFPPSAVVMVLLIVGDKRTVVGSSWVCLGTEVWRSAAICDDALVEVGICIDDLAVNERRLCQGIVALNIVIQVHVEMHRG